MGTGALSVIENPVNNFWPTLPLGSVLVGGVTGIVVGNVLDAVMAPKTLDGKVNFTNVAVKAGAMVVLSMYGGKVMSGTGVLIAIGILGAQIVGDLFEAQLRKLINWLKSIFGKKASVNLRVDATQTPSGLGGLTGMDQGGFRHDLYAGVFG